MSFYVYLATTALLLVVATGTSQYEDVQDGYLFVFHEEHDFVLAAKEGNCYFVPLSDLKMNSLYSSNLKDAETAVLKLLNGTTPADVTLVNATAIHAKFQDEFADILCQGRQLHVVTILKPTTPPPCVDAVSSAMSCTSLTDVCSTPNAAELCRKYCRLCQSDQLSCNFEQGLCGWTNSLDDQFDWVLHRGSTPTAGSGPMADHTLGTSYGHYLYIETSAPRRPGDAAYLQSATLADSDTHCLSFWYHMYGANLGSLTVHMQDFGGNLTTLWSASGRSEERWRQASLVFLSRSPVSVVFEGVTGDGYGGDIAIDDIHVQSGPCS